MIFLRQFLYKLDISALANRSQMNRMDMRVFNFGKSGDVMTDKQSNPEKGAAPVRAPKKEVDLFPAERRPQAAPHMAPAGGGMRLGTQISIFNPANFDDALEIVECLRGRAGITISLDQMKKPDANRLIDFVTGASAALDGDFHRLTDQVYVFCPSNIRIVAPEKQKDTKPGPGALDFLFSAEVIGADKSGIIRKS